MYKWVKNNSGITKTWVGQEISDQTYYQIQSVEDKRWAEDSTVLSDIASGDIIVAKSDSGTDDIADVNDAIVYMKGLSVDISTMPAQNPFAAKTLSNGKSLYRRVHGVKKTLSGDTVFDLVVPYNECKINALEIVWAPAGLQVDLKVYDTPTGTISTVPNYMLNQFGFDAGIAKDYYAETSNYDADLIKDMKIEVTVKNPNSSTDEVCVNFILHEIK